MLKRLPSMEPRPFSRGNWLIDAEEHVEVTSFNGAATFQSRKRPLREPHRAQMTTFNGAATFQSRKLHSPRLQSFTSQPFNGAATFQSRKPRNAARPQRGLRLPSMEPRPFSRGNREDVHAAGVHMSPSMEPRPFSRGNDKMAKPGGADIGPSMEPRPFSRGNVYAQRTRNRDISTLQWSRDLSVAETMCVLHRRPSRATKPSMEPRPFSRGNSRPMR